MTETTVQTTTTKIAAFEGLRGVLALIVCLGHFGLSRFTEKFGIYVSKQLAVFIFFALSGFVLSRANYFGRRPFGRLAVSRFARLYPLHLATWLWGVAFLVATQKALDPVSLWMSFFLLHNLGLPGTSWSVDFPSWSISVEMYLSLAFYVIARRRSTALTAVMIATGVFFAALWASSDLEMINTIKGVNVGIACGLGGFPIGIAAYCLFTDHAERFAKLARYSTPVLVTTLAFLLLPLDWFRWLGAPFALMTLLLLLALSIADRESVLSSRPMVWLGAISYSLYLIHIPMLLSATALFGVEAMRGASAKLPLLAATLAVSALCHRYFELPAQAAILAWFARRSRGAASTPQPSN